MISICLTPNPKGEHLKIIELGSPPSGDLGGQILFGVRSTFEKREIWNPLLFCSAYKNREF